MHQEELDRRGLRRFQICMAVGSLVFLGLALSWSLWFPNLPAVAAVLVVYAAHSAVHLARSMTSADSEDCEPAEE